MAKTSIVKKDNGSLASLVDADDAALGGKVTSADLSLPFLKVLQGLSGQMKRDNPNFIKGAAVGDICLTVLNELWEGKTGVDVVFCHYSRVYVEWRPLDQGGGIVNTFQPEDWAIKSAIRGEKGMLLQANGNQLIETAYHAMLVDVRGKWIQCVMPLKSTMLKISRRLNNQLTSFELPDRPGIIAPRWVRVFKFTTATEAAGGNDWAVPVFEPQGLVNRETYAAGKAWAIAAGNSTNFASAEAAQEPKDESKVEVADGAF